VRKRIGIFKIPASDPEPSPGRNLRVNEVKRHEQFRRCFRVLLLACQFINSNK
jgi:hypothetical protein